MGEKSAFGDLLLVHWVGSVDFVDFGLLQDEKECELMSGKLREDLFEGKAWA